MRNKPLKWILAALLVVVLAVSAVLVTKYLPERIDEQGHDDTDVTDPYTREKTLIYSISNINLIQSVSVKNPSDSFTLVRDEAGKVRIKGLEAAPLLPETSRLLFECMATLYSETTIELSASDLARYGLDEPQATLTVTLASDSVEGQTSDAVFYIGDRTPDCGAYYFRCDGSRKVYAVSTYFAERVLRSRAELFDKKIHTVYAAPALDADLLRLEFANGHTLLATAADDVQYARFGSPFVVDNDGTLSGGNASGIRNAFSAMFLVDANEIVCSSPTAEELTRFGFDNAVRVSLRMTVDTSQPTLNNLQNPLFDPSCDPENPYVSVTDTYTVGAYDAARGVRYVMYNDGGVIYAVDKEAFAFADYSDVAFCQSTMLFVYLVDVKTATVTYGGNSYTFDVFVRTTTEGSRVLDYVQYEGKELITHAFQSFYQDVIGISPVDIFTETAQGEPLLTVTLTLTDGTERTMAFFELEGEAYAVVRVDGVDRYVVVSNRVDYIMDDVQKMIKLMDFEPHYI